MTKREIEIKVRLNEKEAEHLNRQVEKCRLPREAYLRHLIIANEMLGAQIASQHNLSIWDLLQDHLGDLGFHSGTRKAVADFVTHIATAHPWLLKIGVAFDCQRVEHAASGTLDAVLDAFATEKGIYCHGADPTTL